MSDQNEVNDEENNPIIAGEADKTLEEVSREDCYWGIREEDTLYDAYLMLRDAGYSKEELKPLAVLIAKTTIYEEDTPESFYNRFIAE